MKKLTNKTRHKIYKDTLKRILAFKELFSFYLCCEFEETMLKMKQGDAGDLPEFMLFKPENITLESGMVWFDKADFDDNDQNGTERFGARVFVLQMLIEMTK